MSGRVVHGYLPKFHNAQIEIADSEARFKVVSAGRRFGKGVLGVSAAFRMASRGGKCRWIAPSYSSDSYQSGWRLAVNLAGQIPGVDVHLQRREISFARVGGGWLQFKTAEEPDSLRGEGIDFCVFDEAAHIDHLEDMWEQCVRPSLMDRRGDAWFISTPNGFNYFNNLFLRGRTAFCSKCGGTPIPSQWSTGKFYVGCNSCSNKTPTGGTENAQESWQLWNEANGKTHNDWASFQFPTSANPHIAFDEIAELRKSLPALVARQEIDAEFVQLAGALFKRQNILVIDTEPQISYCRSWDLAFTEKTTSDWTAGARMGITQDGTVVIADVVCGQMEWPDAVRLIANTAKLDGTSVRQGIECVSAQVGVLQTLLRDPLLLAHTFTPIEVHRDKLTRALPLVARSEQGKLAIVRGNWNQKFVDELCAFPEGMHDDQVDAASGGMTLLTLATGAIDERSMSQIKVGSNQTPHVSRPMFTPRRLALA